MLRWYEAARNDTGSGQMAYAEMKLSLKHQIEHGGAFSNAARDNFRMAGNTGFELNR